MQYYPTVAGFSDPVILKSSASLHKELKPEVASGQLKRTAPQQFVTRPLSRQQRIASTPAKASHYPNILVEWLCRMRIEGAEPDEKGRGVSPSLNRARIVLWSYDDLRAHRAR